MTLITHEPFDNQGLLFERRIIQWAKDLVNQVPGIDAIYDENDLRKMFGWQSMGVDVLITKGDYVIAIQTKYRKTRRREDHGIHNFVRSLEFILEKTKKKLFLGFWISRIKPFDDNIGYLQSKNIHCVYYFDCMDILIDLASKSIFDAVQVPLPLCSWVR